MPRLAQHFLTDKNILAKIISAAEVSNEDTVLEIGHGRGSLTALLAERAKRVVAVEKDPALCALLYNKFADNKKVEIIHADALRFSPTKHQLQTAKYKIVANIPYYISGRILRLMFEQWPRPSLAALMLQKEVAERIIAQPPKMNRLAAIIQYFASPEIVSIVRAGSFSPAPKVDSAILLLKGVRQSQSDDDKVINLIAKGFSQPRKHLVSNLTTRNNQSPVVTHPNPLPKAIVLQAIETLGLSPQVRPAELRIEQWKQLSTALDYPLDIKKGV